jgi:hypothetical protein
MRFEVPTAVFHKAQVFWDVTLYLIPDVSKISTAFIFKGQAVKKSFDHSTKDMNDQVLEHFAL